MIASYVAVPGGLVCVFRGLARVLDTRCASLVPTKKQRWWNRGMEMLFCVFVPAASMVTHIVYQKSRYMIYAVSGCINNFDDSAMSLALAFIWPPVICLIACYYCGMSHHQWFLYISSLWLTCLFLGLVLYRLHMYRSQFGEILHASNSRMNKSRFLRLFFLNFTMLLIILPIQCFVVYYNTWLSFPWHTYTWSAVHNPEWGVIVKVPTHGQAFFDRWVPIAASCLVFVFFGCGKDANELYRAFLRFLGFGRCFPCRLPENRHESMAGSTGSRVKLLFHKRWSSTSRYVSFLLLPHFHWKHHSLTNISRTYVNNTLANATNRTHNDNDVEKSLPTLQLEHLNHTHNDNNNTSWLRTPWYLVQRPLTSDRGGKKPATLSLSAPSNTVCTNAWAGMSQSRASSEYVHTPVRKDFIRVRQEISQESELQEVV